MIFKRFFSGLFEKAGKLERPPVDFTQDGWFQHGGDKIKREKALQYSAVFRAVNLISTSVGKLPLVTYKRIDGGKQKAPELPAYNLLRYKPNAEMPAKIFKQTVTAHALLQGDGYAYIFRDGAGRPTELLPLDPTQTHAIRVNAELFYTTIVNGSPLKLLKEDVLHIRGLGYDGLSGYSVLEFGATSMSMALNSQKYTKKFYDNSARPSIILEHPQTFNDEKAIQRLLKQWNNLYSGIDNAHKTAILEQGMKANTITVSAKDAQLIETLKYSLVDIANWFSLPPHKLGDSTRTAYNSIEMENQSFLDETLDNWLVTWEEECRDKLLTEAEKRADSHVIEYTRQALVRADLKTRAQYYKDATAGGAWLTINEVRNMESLNNSEDEFNEIILPANIFGSESEPASAERSLPPVSRLDSPAIEYARQALHHAKQKMLVRIKKDFKHKLVGGQVEKFTEEFDLKHGEIIRRELTPPALVVESLTGESGLIEKLFNEISREAKG